MLGCARGALRRVARPRAAAAPPVRSGSRPAAIVAGMADVCVTLMTLQQVHTPARRERRRRCRAVAAEAAAIPTAAAARLADARVHREQSGLLVAGPQLLAAHAAPHAPLRHEARALRRGRDLAARERDPAPDVAAEATPLTLDDYFNARMISDPLCLFDYTMETDGAVAVITTSAERARDLRQPPVYVLASANGGMGRWGPAIFTLLPACPTSTSRRRVTGRWRSGSTRWPASAPTTSTSRCSTTTSRRMVLMQLEDYGFCPIGEGGPFVADGNIRWPTGTIPVNTHGGNLSEAYIIGMTHIREAVEQLRGTAVNQVEGAEIALVTGGPGGLPVSGTLLRGDDDAPSPSRACSRRS